MRGPDEAVWNLIERMRHGSLPLPNRAWAFPGHVAEHSSERSKTIPACLERYLGDRQIRVAEQGLRPLDATG